MLFDLTLGASAVIDSLCWPGLCVTHVQDLKNAVLLVFANKQDAKDKMSAAEIAQELSLHTIKNHNWHIQVSSTLIHPSIAIAHTEPLESEKLHNVLHVLL